jgi:predicted  nucleic acid-binding Zn-ribbon protein
MDVKHYVSFDAMRAETERCNARLAELTKAGKADDDEASDLSFRVMALGIQMSTLESRVDAGQLSFEAYLAQIDAAIKADAALAKALIGKGRADAAAQVMGRIRIMKAEVDGARKQMAEMAAADPAGTASTPV